MAGSPPPSQPLPPQETGPQSSQADDQVIAALATILASGIPVAAMGAFVLASLTGAGVSLAAATAVWKLLSPSVDKNRLYGPATGQIGRTEASYRAAYLLNASRRIMVSLKTGNMRQALSAERGYYKAHLTAAANRQAVGEKIDATVAQHGPNLRWKAVMDAKTSPECRAANGKTFSVTKPPAIGWPGSVHPSCRCEAVPASVGAPVRQLVHA